MDNQHRRITGYRELTEVEIAAMNDFKAAAERVGKLMEDAHAIGGVDLRALAIAQTQLQTGFMWAVRAIARPTTF